MPLQRPFDLTTVHRLFEAQAAQSPHAVALVFKGERLTYAELNRRANQLAHRLRRLGMGPETLCGIYIERSPEMLVAILGVLKAGGAYVPLDPAYPQERLAHILEDAQMRVVLTQESLGRALPKHAADVLHLDVSEDADGSWSADNPALAVTRANLAYVIYTSGSTGRPKGVAVSHGSLAHLFESTRSLFCFDERDAWTVFHSFAFDLSVWEMFGALTTGARLVVVPAEVAQSPTRFYELLRSERVTVLSQTPSAIRRLAEIEGSAERIARELSLRLIVCGGEALAGRLASALLKWRIPLWNFYGPTEATVWACAHRVTPADSENGWVPIGRGLPDAEIHLLGPDLRPVAADAPGEIYIGGPGVARGYFNRPELTARSFVPDPFSHKPGARLYKSGDRARRLADGQLKFIGRIDRQVKVRGFRIELGEIESALTEHPAVAAAVVTTREDEFGEKRLDAYIVAAQAPPVDVLVGFLKGRLPDYMMPSTFTALAALPLNANGKIDHGALPQPGALRPQLRQEFRPPEGEVERKLKQIWEDAVGIRPVGVGDNFFELGGDSLLAVRMLTDVQETFGKDFPISVLIEGGTISHLARLIETDAECKPWSPLVEFQLGSGRPPLFLVHPIGGGVSGYRTLARLLGSDQPFYGIQARGLDGLQEPFSKIEPMAAYYVGELLRVQPRGPVFVGGYSFGAVVAFEMARQLRAAGREVPFLGILDEEVPGVCAAGKRSLSYPATVMRNLPHWMMNYIVRRPKDEVLADMLRHARRLGRTAGSRLKLFGIEPHKPNVGDVMDVESLPQTHRRVGEALFESLLSYRPAPYTGRITLYTTGAQRIFSSHGADKGWGRLTTKGVDIHVVSGNHINILEPPHVQTLARKLRESLDQVLRVD